MAHSAQQVQRLEAVFGRHRVKPVGGQQLAHHFAGLGIVFDDKHVPDRQACGSAGIKSRTGVDAAESAAEWRVARPIVSCFYAHDC